MDKVLIALSFGCVVLGVWGYYAFSDYALVLRVLMVLGGLLAAGWRRVVLDAGPVVLRVRAGVLGGGGPRVVAQPQGNAADDGGRFVFVVVMALFLFSVDTLLAWIVKLATGRGA
jgi:preprotein translocase subunit SecE